MFCSGLPQSYEPTAQQYVDNITSIANYKLMDIITQVLQEESRRKAQAIGSGLSLNKFLTMKNLGQKCAKCGKINHKHTKQLAWRETPKFGQRKIVPKSVKFLGKQKQKQQKRAEKRKWQGKCMRKCQCIR